ncbi:snurportin-1 [Pararge aegeria]|uniref:snurportin-1 n=1 Tax=Pararge aegeria TaxID=116150 RepID=UPI0019D10673|nr:snurportin-1 [Pararge aegeria]
MEDDLEILERALSNLEATESQEKSYEGLYKNWGKSGSQEERRAELLETQKANRNNKIDRFRGILELVNAVEDNNNLFNTQEKGPYSPKVYVAGFHKTCLKYSNVLMLSEWMIEKPSDFEKNWFVVPCPKGVRLLVIANNGITKFYTKYGQFKFERYTGLPGGNPYNFYRKHCCVLDCFYYQPSNTLYIVDLLAWNNQPMTDGETEFRRYWMQTQLEDFPDTKTINNKNKVIIDILPMMPCTTHYLSFMLSSYPYFKDNFPPLDGLLFYHKKAHYVAGQTPLVGWLYPYMIPEVLGEEITMHPGYLEEMPADYVNQGDFIEKFEAKHNKKNKRGSSNAMETNSTNDVAEKNENAVIGNNEDMETNTQDREQKNGEVKEKGTKSKKSVTAKEGVSMETEEAKSNAAKPISSE